MNINEYDYDLPEKFIAQTPLLKRDESKLMIVDKNAGNLKHETFKNIIDYINPGDVLVLNDTKVLPARIFGVKEETEAKMEVLLLKEVEEDTWDCLVKPGKRMKVGTIVKYGDNLTSECLEILDDGLYRLKFSYSGIFIEILESIGAMPLPPYIHEELKENDRYQTVYAKTSGSAAAPTAGLHFTKELLNTLKEKGVIITYVTLHVGLGTFRPVSVEKITDHKMHSEWYSMTSETANILNNAKENGNKIYAVGTTSVRTLESVWRECGTFKECSGNTEIFIYPPYEYKTIDGLITNFHLPKSTLLLLVSALASKEIIMNAYEEAKKNEYRFFSFGDAMFIK